MKKFSSNAKWANTESNCDVMSIRYSNDGQLVACGLSNGTITLKSVQTGRTSFKIVHSKDKFAVTAVRFNPVLPKSFLTVSSEGSIKEWNSKNPKNTWTLKEEDNEIYGLDIHKAGAIFATAGKDATVRVYDGRTKKLKASYARNKYDYTSASGHSNRIYCVHFTNNDPNVLASGGWDNTVQLWDIRQTSAIMVLPGPHICGDSIDTCGNLLIAGSWRTHEQLQLFDLRTGKMMNSARWAVMGDDRQTQVYTTRFINDKCFVAAGSGVNQAKVVSTETLSSVGASLFFKEGVFGCDVSKDGRSVVFGTAAGNVQYNELL